MKRVGGLFDRIHPAPALASAAWRAARGKRRRGPVRDFLADLERRTARLGEELRAGRFRFDPYTSFEIREPKSRTIRAPSFRDRVVHHALVAATGPTFERGAIRHSYACRAERGQHLALERAARWTRASEAFLKLDVAKFYDTISHERLRAALRRRFRERRLLDLFERLLGSYSTEPEHGLPIGALTSQYLGNFVLDPVDHWAQQHSAARGYLRYMDDMLFFGDLRALPGIRAAAEERLAQLGLRVKNGGVLNRCALGVPWLGFTLYPDRSRLNALGRRRLRRSWGRLERSWLRGRLPEGELQARSSALFAHAAWATDVAWRRTMLRFSRSGEALEPLEPRPARRLLEQHRQEVPLGHPQQEEARQPQQEQRLPGLSAPRHGGAEALPDDAPSRARLASAGRDEASGRAPARGEIQGAERPAEKSLAGAPPRTGRAS